MSRTLQLEPSVIEDMRNDCRISHLVKREGYVRSRFDDSSPFSALLWFDIRRACYLMRISEYSQSIFEWYLDGFSDSDIAGFYGVSRYCINNSIYHTKQKILRCAELGMITVIIEELGWDGLREYLSS